jgi:hypothetical protein
VRRAPLPHACHTPLVHRGALASCSPPRVCVRVDKAAHDRLLAKAYAFCASIAAKYPSKPPDGASAAASGTESTTETRLPSSVECVRSASATSAGRPIYTARVEWHTQMYKGAPMSATADAVGVGTVNLPCPRRVPASRCSSPSHPRLWRSVSSCATCASLHHPHLQQPRGPRRPHPHDRHQRQPHLRP